MINTKPVALVFLAFLWLVAPLAAQDQVVSPSPTIRLVWMGGNDCPPCVAWRREELPKLKELREFKYVKFSYVTKTIKSAVPPRLFLPDDVSQFKEKLDSASNGISGSPQVALIVNDEVYDYFTGTRSAIDIARMIRSVQDKEPYPFVRCIKLSTKWGKCETAG